MRRVWLGLVGVIGWAGCKSKACDPCEGTSLTDSGIALGTEDPSGGSDTVSPVGTDETDALPSVETDVPDFSSDTDGVLLIPGPLPGIDISHWQGVVNWAKVTGDGILFAYVKATQGTYYKTSAADFSQQYGGAATAGLVRGAYHFADPGSSSGTAQANYFVDNGGGWSADGITLPGVLDFEWNPDGNACYNMTSAQLLAWIDDFANQYEARTGRLPVIYTGSSYWKSCINKDGPSDLPLWVADWNNATPKLPQGWSTWTFWQTSATGSINGIGGDVDTDLFAGSTHVLVRFALDH